MGWNDAIARAGLVNRESDRKLLSELLEHYSFDLDDWELEAFPEMLDKLDEGQSELTPAQRVKVTEAAHRVGADYAPAPVVRGREVELLVKDKPLRPPTRRRMGDDA